MLENRKVVKDEYYTKNMKSILRAASWDSVAIIGLLAVEWQTENE